MRPSSGRGRGARPPARNTPAGRAGRGGRREAPAPPPPPDSPTVTATKQFLKEAGGEAVARPKRALGQNFVIDPLVLDAVASAPALAAGQGVLEVGPGTGNLTHRLLATGAAVTAVEKDDALFARLDATLGVAHPSALRLVHGDVLRVHVPNELAALSARARGSGGASGAPAPSTPRLCVVANLPYNITGDALRLFLPMGGTISDVYLMLQAEAAERYATAAPSTHAWRGATVLARHYADIDLLERIPAAAFLPAPRVDSALVRFRLKPPSARAELADDRLFKAVVVAAFNQRRKALRNSIATVVGGPSAAAAAVAAAGLGADARADATDVPGFVALANAAAAIRAGW